ncbi:MAG: multicopper oxidase domain-containing protein [Chloroflexota bacterium]|nr:multicopper oxidase domain-containing protein [Chloroflexota bacterium]
MRRRFALGVRTADQRHVACESLTDIRRRVVVRVGLIFWVVSAVAYLVGCGETVNQVAMDTPADVPLSIPELLEPTVDMAGVAYYDLKIGTSRHDYQQTTLTDTYSYNGMSVLGPTLRLKTGDSVVISVTNELDQITTTHWHGADVPAEDDGGPHSLIEPGTTWVADFDVIQPAATLWYHPHYHGSTAEHIYRGAAGMIIIEDDNPAAATLPATYGVDDIPVIIQDRDFTEESQLDFAIDAGGRGNQDRTLTVNGTINPFVEVPRGLVRLRLLNASQARTYNLGVEGAEMIKIASDGGYLASPVVLDETMIAPGDRAEIIIDVGESSAALVDDTFGRVLELRPNGSVSSAGPLPDKLATIDRISESEITVDRTFHFDKIGDGWGINGVLMDMNRIDETVRLGDTERWTITAETGRHVFHVHQTQFQVLSINGEPPQPEEAGWEDSIFVDPGREVVIASRFNSYADNDTPYMYHCHILDHEDLGMMRQFLVIDE